jgi:PPOX class probable F420-dependent enzyme
MQQMSREEWRAFVSEGTRTAKVAVTRKDGRPHVAPVWIVLDGEEIVFTTGASSIKGRALQRDGRLAISLDLERPPYAFVRIEGRARIGRDLEELRHWATVIGGRYMGTERAEEYGARNATPDELLVRVRPDRVLAVYGIAD